MRADVIWQELFNYTNGPIIITSTNGLPPGQTNWIRHSGTASPSDALVNNHRLENGATGGTLVNRQDDVHRFFTAPYTNSVIPVYASFIVNCTNLPNAAGTYFAHFYTNSTIFQGRVFALAGTNLCLPNTWRLGVSGAAGSANQIFPIDLAMNQNYQVVVEWDPSVSYSATLWVNPVSSADTAVVSSDTISGIPCPALAFAFRQASSFGNWFCTISNLVTATTFSEAATNVWASNSVPPNIAYPLQALTNYVGVPGQLSIVAAGQGFANFAYQWQKNGANFFNPNGNSNVLSFSSPALTDTGNYGVIVSNLVTGVAVTNPAVLMWVTNGPPVIGIQPTNQAVYPGKNVTTSVLAYGTPPLTYSWLFNGGAPTGANVDPTTTNTASLIINNVQAANGTLGKYSCQIVNAFGSTNSFTNTLTLLLPVTTNIDFIRGQVDSTYFLPTNTSIYYTVSNAVVYTREVTNADGTLNGGPFTGSANAEFYIQDNSGGICVFEAGGTSVQPRQGDIVTVTGPVSQFNSLLEFNLSTADPSTSVTVTGHTNTLPAPVVLPFSFTNGSGAFISVSNVIRKYESRYVALTNVYFPGSSVGGNFASGNYILTNLNGESFTFFLNAANVNIIGQPIPQFASKISGAMGYYNTATATNRSGGFEIDPSSYSDIVVGPNAPKCVIVVSGGGVPNLNWSAQPFVPYSIWWSTNVSGPYTAIATGLTFNTTAGLYTDTVNTNLPTSFYQISSP
jgi:hypothetical protein